MPVIQKGNPMSFPEGAPVSCKGFWHCHLCSQQAFVCSLSSGWVQFSKEEGMSIKQQRVNAAKGFCLQKWFFTQCLVKLCSTLPWILQMMEVHMDSRGVFISSEKRNKKSITKYTKATFALRSHWAANSCRRAVKSPGTFSYLFFQRSTLDHQLLPLMDFCFELMDIFIFFCLSLSWHWIHTGDL